MAYFIAIVIDSLIALMLVLLLGGMLVHYRNEQAKILKYQQVHAALSTLQEQALYRGAMMEADSAEPRRFPLEISPRWFDNRMPVNRLVPPGQPWLDVAPPNDKNDHPPDPVITRPDQAGFWYNPYRGIFRARVTPQFTDEETLKLYNELNGTSLSWLPHDLDPALKPHLQLTKSDADKPADPNDSANTTDSTTDGGDKLAPPPRRTSLVDSPVQ